LHCYANADGTQKIENTGPLTKKRMETIDDEIAKMGAAYLEKQVKAGKPVFLWVNFTHMHLRTHAKPESQGQAGRWQSEYHDAMIDHDKNVGTVLAMIDKLGISDNTIVMYSTDNGPHRNSLARCRNYSLSVARRIPIGKALTVFLLCYAGPVTLKQARYQTT
jgi:arylsulfatase